MFKSVSVATDPRRLLAVYHAISIAMTLDELCGSPQSAIPETIPQRDAVAQHGSGAELRVILNEIQAYLGTQERAVPEIGMWLCHV